MSVHVYIHALIYLTGLFFVYVPGTVLGFDSEQSVPYLTQRNIHPSGEDSQSIKKINKYGI